MAMSSTTTRPNKFNEIFESANRLRTVRNAPNPFLVVGRDDGSVLGRNRATEGQSGTVEEHEREESKS